MFQKEKKGERGPQRHHCLRVSWQSPGGRADALFKVTLIWVLPEAWLQPLHPVGCVEPLCLGGLGNSTRHAVGPLSSSCVAGCRPDCGLDFYEYWLGKHCNCEAHRKRRLESCGTRHCLPTPGWKPSVLTHLLILPFFPRQAFNLSQSSLVLLNSGEMLGAYSGSSCGVLPY